MPLESETVAIPLTKGLDINTDARLVQAPALLEARNARFDGGGSKKRRGHTALRLRTSGAPEEGPGIGEYVWTFGVGYGSLTRPSGEEGTTNWCVSNPEVHKAYGVFSRDGETVVWDGFRLHSYLPSQAGTQSPSTATTHPAVLPALHAIPLGKVAEHQSQPELADTLAVRVLAWVNGDLEARYTLLDSVTGAQIAQGTFPGIVEADFLRAYSLGAWLHVLVRDGDTDIVKQFSIKGDEPDTVVSRSYGPCTHFDLWKVSEDEAILGTIHPEGVTLYWLGTSGGSSPVRTTQTFVPDTAVGTRIAVAATDAEEIGVAWYAPSNQIGVAVCTEDTLLFQDSFTTHAAGTERITIAPKLSGPSRSMYDIFWDDGTDMHSDRFYEDGSGIVLCGQGERFRMRVASRAFCVGDRSFFWAGFNSTLQSTWFLLDEEMLPVGKMDFGVANVAGLGTNGYIAGVNWNVPGFYTSGITPEQEVNYDFLHLDEDGIPGIEDRTRFHSALGYRLRVAPDDADLATAGTYTEPSPRGVYLDFLPPLRTAQAGRATYIAGAQLWSYDGAELAEAGFHLGPEVTTDAVSAGSLTVDGTYSYRVDLCHRNAQNEEVRSLSILTDSVELSGALRQINLEIPTVVTRRTNSYFLIYRNAMSSGTPLVNWWLLNSRDPEDASYRANDLTVTSVSFSDTGAVDDDEIQTRELHPASDTYLQPISAPACEVITAGRDRLWVAGGELPAGQLAPSRLFQPGEVPTFNAYLALQVDRGKEAITALGFIGEIGVIFRENATYILDSDGPDNNASGSWNPPRLALADVGAVSQESVARVVQGIIFQALPGFRLIGPGGALSPVGIPVDKLARDLEVVGSVVMEADQEVRFYGEDETYVYNYLYDTWARWTCGGVGVTKGVDGYAHIARSDGYLWIEDPDTWTDGGETYSHRVRTAWLHGGSLGDFQRVRRVGGLGRYADLDLPDHSLRLELYYDERDFWEDRHEWDLPDSTTNGDTFGAATWGAGVWGDTSATVSNLEDLTWEWERDPAVQKCSVISISLEDVNTDGPGFELSAFTLELARKAGLNRWPARTGTVTSR